MSAIAQERKDNLHGITLLIAVAVSIAVFFTRPKHWLAIYIGAMVFYPTYISVKVGTVDFTVCRIVILAIYLNLFLRTDLVTQFKLIWLDKLLIIYFLCQLAAGATNSPIGRLVENRAGAVLDLLLPYFAVRMIIRNKEQYLALLKGILIVAAPLAIVGFYQCWTGDNPVGFLKQYHALGPKSYAVLSRLGFFRADVTFPMSIMFGLFFAMLGPPCAGLLGQPTVKKMLICAGVILMGIGAFSSMSSGPWLAALVAITFITFYPYRKYSKEALVVVVLMCLIVEIVSNRHFYDVLGGFTINPTSAWYRTKIFEVALFEGGMSGHWMTGYGFADPAWQIGGQGLDIVNHYIFILSRFGLAGLLPFLLIVVATLKKLWEAYKLGTSNSDRWLIWCLASALIGILVAMNSVSLFGQPSTIFYIMLGFCGVMPAIVAKPHSTTRCNVKPEVGLLRNNKSMGSFNGSCVF